MARKSRKVNPITGEMAKPEPKKKQFIVAGYVRISNEQGEHPSSIETQKEMIMQFLDEKSDMIFYRFYIDKGVSSYANSRPAFEQLIDDIKNGICNCIIVKDLSRFGRDYIEIGKYMFSMFPSLGIRFITLTDHYDSIYSRMEDEYPLALRAIANHWYSTDVSQKVKTVIHLKQKHGTFILARAPFGYKKTKNNIGTKYEIDPEAAKIVSEIYKLRQDGKSPYQIAKELNLRDISSPNKYVGVNTDGYWNVGTIRKILQNRFYTGAYVAGKSEHHLSGRFTKSIPKEEWIIIENHHPAIIDTVTFEALQPQEKYPSNNSKTTYHKNLPTSFDGKIYCGYCGRRMKKQGSQKNNDDKYYYLCPTYADSCGVRCQFNKIRADKLKKRIFDEIQNEINKTIDYSTKQTAFEVTPTYKLWRGFRVKKIRELQLQLEHFKSEKGRATFERALKNENLTMIDFNGISIYEKSKIAMLEQEIIKTQGELDHYDKDYSSKAEWILRYLRFGNADEFDPKKVEKLIEKVMVSNNKVEVMKVPTIVDKKKLV